MDDRAGAAVNDDLVAVIALREILGTHGIPHHMNNVLQMVFLRIQAQMRNRGVVAPFNARLFIQQNHPIG